MELNRKKYQAEIDGKNVDAERLKKFTKSRDGRVSLGGAPSVGGTESHFPRAPVCMQRVRLQRS